MAGVVFSANPCSDKLSGLYIRKEKK